MRNEYIKGIKSLLLGLLGVGVLIAQTPTDSIPVARAVPNFPIEPVLEKGFDGKSDNPMSPITVTVLSPKPLELCPVNEVDFFFQVTNYSMAPDGNRLHAILDNQSPVAIDQLKRPLTLKELSPGGHTLRVFAVKPDGRMVADPQAFAMIYFYVIKKDYQNYINPNTPFLTLNMPSIDPVDSVPEGVVWLDYRIHTLSDQGKGLKVRYRLSNIQGIDEVGKGIFWKNLKVGRYDLSVDLIDSAGNAVSGIFNRVLRVFDVRSVQKAILPTSEGQPVVPQE